MDELKDCETKHGHIDHKRMMVNIVDNSLRPYIPSYLEADVFLSCRDAPTLDMYEKYTNIIKACWDKDPARRPSMGDIVHSLHETYVFSLVHTSAYSSSSASSASTPTTSGSTSSSIVLDGRVVEEQQKRKDMLRRKRRKKEDKEKQNENSEAGKDVEGKEKEEKEKNVKEEKRKEEVEKEEKEEEEEEKMKEKEKKKTKTKEKEREKVKKVNEDEKASTPAAAVMDGQQENKTVWERGDCVKRKISVGSRLDTSTLTGPEKELRRQASRRSSTMIFKSADSDPTTKALPLPVSSSKGKLSHNVSSSYSSSQTISRSLSIDLSLYPLPELFSFGDGFDMSGIFQTSEWDGELSLVKRLFMGIFLTSEHVEKGRVRPQKGATAPTRASVGSGTKKRTAGGVATATLAPKRHGTVGGPGDVAVRSRILSKNTRGCLADCRERGAGLTGTCKGTDWNAQGVFNKAVQVSAFAYVSGPRKSMGGRKEVKQKKCGSPGLRSYDPSPTNMDRLSSGGSRLSIGNRGSLYAGGSDGGKGSQMRTTDSDSAGDVFDEEYDSDLDSDEEEDEMSSQERGAERPRSLVQIGQRKQRESTGSGIVRTGSVDSQVEGGPLSSKKSGSITPHAGEVWAALGCSVIGISHSFSRQHCYSHFFCIRFVLDPRTF